MSAMKLTLTTTDGTSHNIDVIFADLIRYDILRSRHNFPAREGNEFLFMGLVSFCSLIRTGGLAEGSSVDAFLNTIATVEPVEEAEFPEDGTATSN